MKRTFVFSFLAILLLFGLCLPSLPTPTAAASVGYSLRFYGHGTGDIDRVKIRIDAPAVPADVASNFTLEFWMKANLADNPSPDCAPGGYNWVYGNILVDRDTFGDGDYGDYGISLANGKIAFGVGRRTLNQTVCGATDVADGVWHHVAVTRQSSGLMRIFVDGVLDAYGSGPRGSISYRNNRTTSHPNSDPFLVLGAEKHDAGAEYPSYNGFLDELRISKSIRYKRDFTPSPIAFTTDRQTAALYHFDEGPAGPCAGTILDSSKTGANVGQCANGGAAPAGPEYSEDIPAPDPGGGGSGGPSLAGCPLFSWDNIWNARVDNLPIHARSAAWVNSIGRATGFHMDFGSGTDDGGPIGIPFNIVSGASTSKYTVDFYYPDESDAGPYPIPDHPKIEWGSDHHILTLDTDDCTLYEIYDASYGGGGWHGGSGAIWDLNAHALRPAGWTSADAAGLPILPGLVRYDEILAGHIDHAIRFTASSTDSYIWPARHLTSGTAGTLTNTPPMGVRFRLKAGYDIRGFAPEMQVILQAMKTYGIILADNGADWYVTGAPDERWDNDMLHTLDVLTGDDFEAVDASGLMIAPDSGQANLPLARWNPSVGDTLQIQYTGTMDFTVNVDIYNLDMFDTTVGQVYNLQHQGRKTMCYINAGAWENWRPDKDLFPEIVLGNDYSGWPGEKWLDIRRIDLLAPIMRARLDECKAKGFDGVDPDNVNGYLNHTGFPLTYADQLTYNLWFANEAHARGLSIGLKNDTEQLADLLYTFDWGLTEDCYDQGWCSDLSPYISVGKPAFAVEYTDTGINFAQFCQQAASLGLTGIQKNRDLDAFLQSCP